MSITHRKDDYMSEINIIKQHNDVTQQWEAMGTEFIANDDGSNMYTPDNVKTFGSIREHHTRS